jgi:hypothetical protein
MLIKTTCDSIDNHFFIGFSDESDTKQDHDITAIYYKIWAMNLVNDMPHAIFNKKRRDGR